MKFVGDAWGHDFELMSTPSERLILSAGKDGVVGSADDLIVIDGRVYISVQSSFDIMLLAALPWVPAIIILVVVLAFLFRKFARKKGRAGIEREGCSA